MKLNGEGAYRTPEVPEGIEIKPLEPFTGRCPVCRKKYGYTMGFPRGRDDYLVIRMEGGAFSRHMVMFRTDKQTDLRLDIVGPELRPHVARACKECHTLRVMKEPALEDKYLSTVLLGLAIALYLVGYVMGALLPPLGMLYQ